MSKINLKMLDTYIYIDASNIRNALKISHVPIDWAKLYKYFTRTYPNLKEINYFEGIDIKNTEKQAEFEQLSKLGYLVKTLERKAYKNSAKYKTFKCLNCKEKNSIEILKESETLKSNIDVYLCSELMGELMNTSRDTNAIILSCDGDFSEMISNMINKNPKIHISILATPFTKYNNYLSVRLKKLENLDRYHLMNILNIKDRIIMDEKE